MTSAATTPAARPVPGDALAVASDVVTWCAGLDLGALPDEVIEVAHHCLLDWAGVCVAGAHEPLTALLVEEVGARADGDATLLGRGQRTGVVNAALVNGAASHALDYDDVHLAMPGHPSAPVFSALLAVAEATAVDGGAFLRAAICGLETAVRLGAVVGQGHYDRGWHATATLGAIGAAVACAEALGADERQRRHALGLAVSQAAGAKAMFGTMAKPFQVGKAAANGALAARLARRGMTSHPDALEDPQGLLGLYGDVGNGEQGWVRSRFALPDTLFKFHAACYLTHAGIEAARALREEGADAALVRRIRLGTNPNNLSVCDIRSPRTGLEAKFSMSATVSMALLGMDTARSETFSDEIVADEQLRELLARVTVEPEPALSRSQMTVTLELEDGSSRHRMHDAGVPQADLRAQRARLAEKFVRLVEPVLGREATDAALGLLGDVRPLRDIGELARLLGGRP